MFELNGHNSEVNDLTTVTDNLFSASNDGFIIEWSLVDMTETHTYKRSSSQNLGHIGPVLAVSISDRYLISGGFDTTARRWDLKTGKHLDVFYGSTKAVSAVLCVNNSVFAGSEDFAVYLYQPNVGSQDATTNLQSDIETMRSQRRVRKLAFTRNAADLSTINNVIIGIVSVLLLLIIAAAVGISKRRMQKKRVAVLSKENASSTDATAAVGISKRRMQKKRVAVLSKENASSTDASVTVSDLNTVVNFSMGISKHASYEIAPSSIVPEKQLASGGGGVIYLARLMDPKLASKHGETDGLPNCFLTDFGITQILSERVVASTMFQIVSFRGLSVYYAAPEAFSNFRSRGLSELIIGNMMYFPLHVCPTNHKQTRKYIKPEYSASSDKVCNYWGALQDDQSEIKSGEVLMLPEGVFILGQERFGSSIYVRDRYPKLLKLCLEIISQPKTPHLVIMGNPGVGLTCFGYFLLHHFARAAATVVYEHSRSQARILFSENVVAVGTMHDFVSYLGERDTIYFSDDCCPVDVAARTILLTSTNCDNWYQFAKDHCTIRYMPIWSKEEIHDCRSKLFLDLTVQQVDDLFNRWGGIPRSVLTYATRQDRQALLNNSVCSPDMDFIIRSISKLDGKYDEPYNIVHLVVTENFERDSFVFASKYVAGKVYERLWQYKRQQLLQFIASPVPCGLVGCLRDALSKIHAHSIIQKDGSFKVRELTESEEQSETRTIEIPKSELCEYEGEQENGKIEARSTYLFMADNTAIFQVNTRNDFPCKESDIDNVVQLMGDPEGPRILKDGTNTAHSDTINAIVTTKSFLCTAGNDRRSKQWDLKTITRVASFTLSWIPYSVIAHDDVLLVGGIEVLAYFNLVHQEQDIATSAVALKSNTETSVAPVIGSDSKANDLALSLWQLVSAMTVLLVAILALTVWLRKKFSLKTTSPKETSP
ncbi:hypothetical protein MP638_004964 [Amoeboaphelidium occidentale]|nr:hypothetical protein MP638_004964 [Amoeboaphelidium occidentale]